MSRRQLLVRSAATLTVASLARPYLSRAADRPLIASGIQSGDVSADSAVIWARADRPARMQVECSVIESFKTIIRSATADALPDHDFVSKVLLDGLPAKDQQNLGLRREVFNPRDGRPALGNPQTGTSPNEALEIRPSPTESSPYRVDKATLEKQPCLSQREVRGGWPKYRIIKGRQCWYASRPADYGSLSPGNAGSGAAEQSQRLGAGECRDQAAKLDAAEKRAFLRECMSSRK